MLRVSELGIPWIPYYHHVGKRRHFQSLDCSLRPEQISAFCSPCLGIIDGVVGLIVWACHGTQKSVLPKTLLRACVCVCVCANCCTYRNGVTPDALTIVIHLHVVLGSSCGGTGGRGGEPCPTKLPHPIPGNVPTLSAPGSLSGQLEGLHPSFHFHLISCCLAQRGKTHTPTYSSHLLLQVCHS